MCEGGLEQLKMQLSVLDEHKRLDPFSGITDSDIDEANEENERLIDQDDSDVDIGSISE